MPRAPKQVYSSRRPGTNPRTGDKLVHWSEVQASDFNVRPLATYFVKVEIATDHGSEFRQFKVRAPPDIQHTPEVEQAAVEFVRKLGFQTTGQAKHE